MSWADGAFLLYDVTKEDSFSFISAQFEKLSNLSSSLSLTLVANMTSSNSRRVPTKEGAVIAENLKCPFWEISVKDEAKVKKLFLSLIRSIQMQRAKKSLLQKG